MSSLVIINLIGSEIPDEMKRGKRKGKNSKPSINSEFIKKTKNKREEVNIMKQQNSFSSRTFTQSTSIEYNEPSQDHSFQLETTQETTRTEGDNNRSSGSKLSLLLNQGSSASYPIRQEKSLTTAATENDSKQNFSEESGVEKGSDTRRKRSIISMYCRQSNVTIISSSADQQIKAILSENENENASTALEIEKIEICEDETDKYSIPHNRTPGSTLLGWRGKRNSDFPSSKLALNMNNQKESVDNKCKKLGCRMLSSPQFNDGLSLSSSSDSDGDDEYDFMCVSQSDQKLQSAIKQHQVMLSSFKNKQSQQMKSSVSAPSPVVTAHQLLLLLCQNQALQL